MDQPREGGMFQSPYKERRANAIALRLPTSLDVQVRAAAGWRSTADNTALRDWVESACKERVTGSPASTPEPSPDAYEYEPIDPKPVWFDLGAGTLSGTAIAFNGRGMVRIDWGMGKQSDVPFQRVSWLAPGGYPIDVIRAAINRVALTVQPRERAKAIKLFNALMGELLANGDV